MSNNTCCQQVKAYQNLSEELIINYPREKLSEILFSCGNDIVYYYVIRSVDFVDGHFVQRGSGPNFEGGVITLCTCKHYLRTFPGIKPDVWLAGITSSKTGPNRGNYLFYLAQIKYVYITHYELWNSLPAQSREKKNATYNRLGDVFEPIDSMEDYTSIRSYQQPIHNHSHAESYKYDIESKYHKPSKLIVFDKDHSLIWDSPLIQFKDRKLTQGQSKIKLLEFMGLFD